MKLHTHHLNLPHLLWSLVLQAKRRNKQLKKHTKKQKNSLYFIYPYIISLIKHRASLPQKTLVFSLFTPIVNGADAAA